MATFAGTTQKCKGCDKTVYLVVQLAADNKVYHKACFRCHHCKSTLKLELRRVNGALMMYWNPGQMRCLQENCLPYWKDGSSNSLKYQTKELSTLQGERKPLNSLGVKTLKQQPVRPRRVNSK